MKNIIQKKIENIKERHDVCGILLVGSFREKYRSGDFSEEEIKSDIDLFAVTEEKEFERSVDSFSGVEFDISFITKEQLKKAAENETHSLISMLSDCEVLEADEETEKLLEEIRRVYEKGPEPIDKYFTDYKRFVFTSCLRTIKKRRDRIEFDILFNSLVAELLKFHYLSSGKWIPPEKNLLKFIEDSNILYILKEIYTDKEKSEKIRLIEELFYAIMSDYGGKLDIWNEGRFPFDFK